MEHEFLLTKPQWAPEASLMINDKLEYCVFVAGEPVTDCFANARVAIEQYCYSDVEFITDFLHGVHFGECGFGDNYYGQLTKQMFERINKERRF